MCQDLCAEYTKEETQESGSHVCTAEGTAGQLNFHIPQSQAIPLSDVFTQDK